MAGLSVFKRVVLGSVLVWGFSAHAHQADECNNVVGSDFVDSAQFSQSPTKVGPIFPHVDGAVFGVSGTSQSALRDQFPRYEEDLYFAVYPLIEDKDVLDLSGSTHGLSKEEARDLLIEQKIKEFWRNRNPEPQGLNDVLELLGMFGYTSAQVWAAIEFVATR